MFPQASTATWEGDLKLTWLPVGFASIGTGTGLTEEATTGGTYVWAWAVRHRSVADAIASKTMAARQSANLPEERATTVFDVSPIPSSGRRNSSTTLGSIFVKGEAAMGRVGQLKMILNKWSSSKSGHVLIPPTESI
jgi:hypothetical protein